MLAETHGRRVDPDTLVALLERASKSQLLTILINLADGGNVKAQQNIYTDLCSMGVSLDSEGSETNEDECIDADEDEDEEGASDESSDASEVEAQVPFKSAGISSLLNPVQEAAQAVNQAAEALQPRGIKRFADEANAEPQSESSTDSKRLKAYHQSLLARCLNCGAFRDKSDSASEVCIYHDGELVVDDLDEAFPDDDRTAEELDSDNTRIELPEYFTWDCCDRTGEHGGCQRGKHAFTGSKTHQCRLEMLKEI